MNASAQARQLLSEGRVAEAEQAYERVLQQAPEDAEALNVIALAALRRRDCPRAVQLLQRAVTAHPDDFHSRFHLGRACDEAGELSRALVEYQAALQIDPGAHVARLYYGYALDRSGEPQRALGHYVAALDRAQGGGRWLDPGTTPANLRPLVEQAVRAVRGTRRAIADEVLSSLRLRYGESELGRVAQALRIYLRQQPPMYPDPRQRPRLFYFQGLPPSPYLERKLFDWIDALEQQAAPIRAELQRLLPSGAGRERVFLSEEVERASLRGVDAAPTWNGYYLYRHGQRREDNCAACPSSAAAIDALPLSRVAGHGPEVLYSVFTPGTHLLPHCGVTNTRLVGHLPLIVPPDCALKVGGELHVWQPGRVVVFDDTYEHEAWNRSDQIRVVMIFDIWNPYLTPVERLAVAELIPRIGALQPAA
ncbi:MAG TPA: aspartyl/asparaginyl beta-hydroxylase domain-containing protein [Steroidobacteraceae bacterium]|jgi:aspartate beta-hydroxylase|nr:aspartyl/asparaginyl beta-hydroxylase domain-containing protein [Steroidobacteraceae bacterium]